MRYLIYDKDSGNVVSSFNGNHSDMVLNVPSGMLWIESELPIQNNQVKNGEVVSISDEAIKAADRDYMLTQAKGLRNSLLASSDWTQSNDSPMNELKINEWAIYRQALRDMPETYDSATSLSDIIWPTKPE